MAQAAQRNSFCGRLQSVRVVNDNTLWTAYCSSRLPKGARTMKSACTVVAVSLLVALTAPCIAQDHTRHPGLARPLSAGLEEGGQAARHRLLLRRRLDERHRQAVRAAGSLSGQPGHGGGTGGLSSEIPA